jgi:hypothetical protein
MTNAGGPQTRRITRLPTRTSARAALAVMTVATTFGLGACGPIDDLRDALSQMAGKSPAIREPVVVVSEPEATPAPAPERPPKKPAVTAKKNVAAKRQVQRPQIVEKQRPRPVSTAPAKPAAVEPPAASTPAQPSTPAPPSAPGGLRTLWPDAPPTGSFSR